MPLDASIRNMADTNACAWKKNTLNINRTKHNLRIYSTLNSRCFQNHFHSLKCNRQRVDVKNFKTPYMHIPSLRIPLIIK